MGDVVIDGCTVKSSDCGIGLFCVLDDSRLYYLSFESLRFPPQKVERSTCSQPLQIRPLEIFVQKIIEPLYSGIGNLDQNLASLSLSHALASGAPTQRLREFWLY
jgi:hypothetical protein